MELSLDSLKEAEELIANYNTSTASDLGTGIVSLKAAAQGAYMNVLINVSGIKDEEYALAKKNSAEELMSEISELSDRLYQKILEEIG